MDQPESQQAEVERPAFPPKDPRSGYHSRSFPQQEQKQLDFHQQVQPARKDNMDMDKQHSSEEDIAGGFGTPTPEQETAGPGDRQARPQKRGNGSTSEATSDGSAAAPSADTELDGSNTGATEPGQQFSSEPKGDATGLPEETSPKDDDGERFDAG